MWYGLTVNIRKGEIKDFKNVEDLVIKFFDESIGKYGFKLNEEQVWTMMAKLCENSFVVEVDNKVVGVIAGIIEQAFGTNDKAFHEVIWYVDDKYRRYGIKLLRECEKWCIDNKIKFLMMCNMGNLNDDKLESFYIRYGFKLFEKQYIKEL